MMARNKIDAVNFDLNNVRVKYEEILNFDLKIYEMKNGAAKPTLKEEQIISKEKLIEEWKGQLVHEPNADVFPMIKELEYNKLEHEFVNKCFALLDGSNLYVALIVEPSDSLVFDTRIDAYIEQNRKNEANAEPQKPFYNSLNQNLAYIDGLLYHEKIVGTMYKTNILIPNTENEFSIKYFNEKQLIFYFKFEIFTVPESYQKANFYTESITFSIRARTWSADKTTHHYRLSDNGLYADEIEQKPDGTFKGAIPKYPFEYPSNELLQYDTKLFDNDLMHQTIAKELLKTYRNGRRMAEFDLPDVAIYHCDQYGAYISVRNEKRLIKRNKKSIMVGNKPVRSIIYEKSHCGIAGLPRIVRVRGVRGVGSG
jgi:hypothetical protein